MIARATLRRSALQLSASLLAAQAAMLAAPALAQDAAEGTAARDDEIVITGSRVRGEAPVGSTVTSLGRAEIEASSAVTVDRMIKEIPQNFDLGVSENSRGQSGGSGNITYGNTVNLRGIGPYATLVLIDGHRVTYNSRSVDPSVIPSLGVERIEYVANLGLLRFMPREAQRQNAAQVLGDVRHACPGSSSLYPIKPVPQVMNEITPRHFPFGP